MPRIVVALVLMPLAARPGPRPDQARLYAGEPATEPGPRYYIPDDDRRQANGRHALLSADETGR